MTAPPETPPLILNMAAAQHELETVAILMESIAVAARIGYRVRLVNAVKGMLGGNG